MKECVNVWLLIVCVKIRELDIIWLCCDTRNITVMGKFLLKAPYYYNTNLFYNGNVLSLSLFSLSKNIMHTVGWDCAEILPSALFSQDRRSDISRNDLY